MILPSDVASTTYYSVPSYSITSPLKFSAPTKIYLLAPFYNLLRSLSLSYGKHSRWYWTPKFPGKICIQKIHFIYIHSFFIYNPPFLCISLIPRPRLLILYVYFLILVCCRRGSWRSQSIVKAARRKSRKFFKPSMVYIHRESNCS